MSAGRPVIEYRGREGLDPAGITIFDGRSDPLAVRDLPEGTPVEERWRIAGVDNADDYANWWLEAKRRELQDAPDPGRVSEFPVDPWPIPDSLMIFEAAVAYVGGHPHHPFAPVPARDDWTGYRLKHADFYGFGSEIGHSKGPDAYFARDVLNELTRRVTSGAIVPLRRADLDNGEPDPLYTEIPLAALLALARERRDAVGPIRDLADAEASRDWRLVPMNQQGSWARNPAVEGEARRRAEAERAGSGGSVREIDLCRALEKMASEGHVSWTAKNLASRRRKPT